MVNGEEFFEDGLLAVAEIGGTQCQTRVFLDCPVEDAFSGTVNTTAFEIRYATAALPGMRKGQAITVNGEPYKLNENPKAVFDAVTSVATLTKVKP